MTGLVVQCPKCELRFTFRTEMEHHLREDHPQPATTEPTAMVEVVDPIEHTATTVGSDTRRKASSWSPARLAGLFLAIVAVLVAVYAAVFVSVSSAVAAAVVAVLVLALTYVRRLPARPRVPRR